MDNVIIEIPQELLSPAESRSYAGVLELPTLEAGPDTYEFAEPLTWDVFISNTGEALLVDGTVTGVGTTACARCLEPMDVAIDGHVEGYFLLPNAEDPEDRDEDEFDRLPDSGKIDLEPLIIAAVLVELPLMPLCREDCKGLCPDCGVNLNLETCDCAEKRAKAQAEEEAAAHPFAALKDYHFDD